jgi:CubicO group peptidase (beta-lactamase class C family)
MATGETLFRRWDGALDYVEEWLRYRQWMHRIPGMQVAIRYGGRSALSASFGVTSEQDGEAVSTRHLFRIASQSKTFTATAVLQLVERGLLGLDEPVGEFVPELESAPDVSAITLRELLTHTSGLICDGWGTDRGQLLKPSPDEAEILRTVIEEGRVLAPLVAAKYSNLGYNLLGIVISRATGLSYADYVRTNIITPLGLDDTGPDLDLAREGEFVTGHSGLHLSRTRRTLPLVDSRAAAPCGGFYSTAEDLTRYFEAHLFGDERLLTDRSKRLMQHPEWIDPASRSGASSFTPGMKSHAMSGSRFLGQPGGHPGGQASLSMFNQATGLVVSIATNAIDAPTDVLMNGVLELLEIAGDDPRSESGPGIVPGIADAPLVDLSAAEMTPFVGRFATEWGVTDVAALGGKLFAISHRGAASPTASASRVVVTAADELRYLGAASGLLGERMHFVRDERGATVRIEGRGGMTLFPADSTFDAAVR